MASVMPHTNEAGADSNESDLLHTIRALGPRFAERVSEHDANDTFVAENYAELRERRVFSAAVPAELGGGGVSHREMCRALRTLAGYCSSTALSLSMHQHLVAAAVWNYRRGNPGQALLEKVAAGELVLISTGARDWLGSNGSMERVDGGYRVTAKKVFASGCPAGQVLITSAPYDDPDEGPQVLHFPLPVTTEGVRIDENWRAMGMRGTGSNTVVIEEAFVPDESIVLRRPRGAFHPVWSVVLTVAAPLISAVYVGVAEAAAAIARRESARRREDPTAPFILGEMENELATAQMALDGMVDLANDFDFEPHIERTNAVLIRKTIAVRAALATTEKALEAVGGPGFFRPLGLERLVRDAHAGQFHPLSEKKQQHFSGRLALGLEPIA